jgi:hypothetical protein
VSKGAPKSVLYLTADHRNKGCSIGSLALSGRVGDSQKVWLKALQDRLSYTSEVLGNIRSLKLLGLGTRTVADLCRLRETELKVSLGFRRLLVWTVGLCKCDVSQPGNPNLQSACS